MRRNFFYILFLFFTKFVNAIHPFNELKTSPTNLTWEEFEYLSNDEKILWDGIPDITEHVLASGFLTKLNQSYNGYAKAKFKIENFRERDQIIGDAHFRIILVFHQGAVKKFRYQHQNGKLFFEASLLDGEIHGTFKFYDKNGLLGGILNYNRGFVEERKTFHPNGSKNEIAFFKSNKLDGELYQYDRYGQLTLKENYLNGLLHGQHVEYHSNGEVRCKISFINGKKDGKEEFWYKNGQKQSEIFTKSGLPNGKAINWYENGQKNEESNWLNGKLNGRYQAWFPSGKLKADGNFSNDNLVGRILNYSYGNGGLSINPIREQKVPGRVLYRYIATDEGSNLNAIWQTNHEFQQDGFFRKYYPSGQIAEKRNYKNDLKDGTDLMWHENGKLGAKAQMKLGKINGKLFFWYPNGAKACEALFKNDVFISGMAWYSDGSSVPGDKIDSTSKFGLFMENLIENLDL